MLEEEQEEEQEYKLVNDHHIIKPRVMDQSESLLLLPRGRGSNRQPFPLAAMSRLRGPQQEGGAKLIGGLVPTEQRLRLQLQQRGQIGTILGQRDWLWEKKGRGRVVHQLLPWTNQRGAGSQEPNVKGATHTTTTPTPPPGIFHST